MRAKSGSSFPFSQQLTQSSDTKTNLSRQKHLFTTSRRAQSALGVNNPGTLNQEAFKTFTGTFNSKTSIKSSQKARKNAKESDRAWARSQH